MTHLYNLKQEFLQNWPLDKLKTMALEEYTNLEKTSSFCYWLEAITTELGSIWGGSAYKFGIYKRQGAKVDNRNAYQTDNEYAWVKKYGNTRDSAFEKVRSLILAVAEYAMANNLKAIDNIDLGDAYKWKIAFLYGDFNVIPIYKYEALENSAVYLGYSGTEKSYSALNEFIISQKGDKEFFEYYRELWNAYENPNDGTSSFNIYDEENETLNQILYGPPGTGKTFRTINEALKIADPEYYEQHANDRRKLKERFKLLMMNQHEDNNGQIAFTTFHQSFSYEDFIEGIKPVKPEDDDQFLKYTIHEGIFKKICRLAKDSLNAKKIEVEIESNNQIALTEEEFANAHFYKMSLGNTMLIEDSEIYNYCITENCITIGFGDGLDYSGMNEKELNEFGKQNNIGIYPAQALNYFKNYLKVGNYVLISNGNYYVRAIGRVEGEYEYREESPFSPDSTYNHFRKVKWLYHGLDIPIKEIYSKRLMQQTIYKLIKANIKPDFFVKKVNRSDDSHLPKNPKNFVLIVDEINRGNVSSIFGELITLIEKDKRAGNVEELSVILPYSKEEFSVPPNLYVIGTMNTADRSVEALDTALRRRFSFTEMPPLYDLSALEYEYAGFQGKDILKTINKRIEKLLDRDHLIGHSYFLKKAEQDAEEKLLDSFYRNIIPLLQEYFYGDYAKIGAVLGKGFIKEKQIVNSKEEAIFADFDGFEDTDFSEKTVYEIVDYRIENLNYEIDVEKTKVSMNFEKAIRLLMNQKITEQVES